MFIHTKIRALIFYHHCYNLQSNREPNQTDSALVMNLYILDHPTEAYKYTKLQQLHIKHWCLAIFTGGITALKMKYQLLVRSGIFHIHGSTIIPVVSSNTAILHS